MKKTTALKVAFLGLYSRSHIVSILLIALAYLIILITVVDTKIFLNIASLNLHIIQKAQLIGLTALFTFLNLPVFTLFLYLTISLLVGLNIELLRQKVHLLTKQKHIKLTFGAGIISLAGAGCTACGFSLVSVIGVGWAASILPFHGFEFLILAFGILCVTLYYNLTSFANSCVLPKK